MYTLSMAEVQTGYVSSSEQQVKGVEGYASQVAEIGRRADTARSRITRLATSAFVSTEQDVASVTIDSVDQKLAELVAKESTEHMTKEGAIVERRHMLDQVAAILREKEAARRRADEAYSQAPGSKQDIWDWDSFDNPIDPRLAPLKDAADAATEACMEAETAGRTLIDRLYLKMSEDFMALTREELQSVQHRYEGLLRDIYQDGTLVRAVGEAYIAQTITPKLAELQTVDPEKHISFFNVVGVMYEENMANAERRRALLDPFLRDSAFADRDIKEAIYRLQLGADFQGVNNIVSSLYQQDIERIGTELDRISPRENDPWVRKLLTVRTIYPNLSIEDFSEFYGNMSRSIFLIDRSTGRLDIDDRKLFETLQATPEIMQLFGGAIEQIREQNAQRLLDLALSDNEGSFVHALGDYPSADTIRILLLLATSTSNPYIRSNANGVLTDLAGRDNWEELLRNAEAEYPYLQPFHDTLTSWTNYGQVKNPALEDFTSEFIMKTLLTEFRKEETKNEKLLQLVLSESSEEVISEILASRKVQVGDEAYTLDLL